MELVGKGGKIVLVYSAKSVNIVAAGKGQATVKLYSKDNNEVTNDSIKGNDLNADGKLTIDVQKLCNTVDHINCGNHYIEIDAKRIGSKYIPLLSIKTVVLLSIFYNEFFIEFANNYCSHNARFCSFIHFTR